MTYLLATFYFDYVNKHYIYFAQIGFCLSVICVVFTFFFVSESPTYLLKSGQIERAKVVITSIAKRNKLTSEATDLIEMLESE